MKKLYMAFLGLMAVWLLSGCGRGENLSIEDFRLKDSGTPGWEAAEEAFSCAVGDILGRELKTAGEGTEQRRIYLLCGQEAAAGAGYDLTQWEENAFALSCRNTDLYFIAPSAKGIGRAAVYFIKNYMGEDGEVLLREGDYYAEQGTRVKDRVYVGDTPLEEYVITYSDRSCLEPCRELQYYISQTGGGCLPVRQETEDEETGVPRIRLVLDKSLGEKKRSLEVKDGQVTLAAFDVEAMYDNVWLFLDAYLGWIKAGTDQAHISNTASEIRVPDQVSAPADPWIEEREAIITLWNVNKTRGFYLNTNTSLKNNVIDFSEDQLYEYVKMLKYCGFTGIQVTDMCTVWAGVGGYETAHAKIRILAEAAHSLDMKFTLWVWGAEFSDFGWVDPEAVYTYREEGYACARENPDVVATFEKYYTIYAELADVCDRVIGHYYDPGRLDNAEDIAYFARMLRDKVRMVNPDVDFGVSCWVDAYDKAVFIRELGTDITLYESGHHENEGDYTTFRSDISRYGVRLGTWAWNTCEMEIDQLAQMNFNMDNIRYVYQTARKYDEIAQPSYWSEMDSYHVLNVFSLYCAGRLLIDPDMPSETLYEDLTTAVVGPKYAEEFAGMLDLIQDARTGPSWDTYTWSNENYILKSDEYPAEDILERCERYIPVLQEMIRSGLESYTLPLPISLQDLLSMMLPHLQQIRSYALFRIGLAELKEDWEQGTSAEQLAGRLYEIAEPIEEYDCIIGAWGQVEARAQYEMIQEFCGETGLEVPRYPAFEEGRKQMIIAQMISFQRNRRDVYIAYAPYYQYGVAFGVDETSRLVNELVQEGLLICREEDAGVYLANWEDYTYAYDRR